MHGLLAKSDLMSTQFYYVKVIFQKDKLILKDFNLRNRPHQQEFKIKELENLYYPVMMGSEQVSFTYQAANYHFLACTTGTVEAFKTSCLSI